MLKVIYDPPRRGVLAPGPLCWDKDRSSGRLKWGLVLLNRSSRRSGAGEGGKCGLSVRKQLSQSETGQERGVGLAEDLRLWSGGTAPCQR